MILVFLGLVFLQRHCELLRRCYHCVHWGERGHRNVLVLEKHSVGNSRSHCFGNVHIETLMMFH